MRLEDINYDYSLETESFEQFTYEFSFPFENKMIDEIKGDIQKCFEKLERILGLDESMGNIEKKRIGRMNSRSIAEHMQVGFAYIDKNSLLGREIAKLSYDMGTKNRKIAYTGFFLSYSDNSDIERMLSLFDRIIADPEIERSELAEEKIKRINLLREGVHDKGLCLNALLP